MAFLSQFGDFDASALEPLQRILLISDGTLTDTLEAAFLESIGLRKLLITNGPSPVALPELELAAGEPLMQRTILLYGETTGRTYVRAESQLALQRLPPRFQEELVDSNMPMGRLWSAHRLETWKELLMVARHEMGGMAVDFGTKPEAQCLARRYRVISGGRPLMLIAEHFPLRYAKPHTMEPVE